MINKHFYAGLIMPRGIPISKELKQKVVNAFLAGKKQAAISRQFVLPRYSVSKIILCYNERGYLENLPKSGRPRKTTIWIDRRIKNFLKTIHGCLHLELLLKFQKL